MNESGTPKRPAPWTPLQDVKAWIVAAALVTAIAIGFVASRLPRRDGTPKPADAPIVASVVPTGDLLAPWPLYFSGRVVDASGKPLADWPVWQGRMMSGGGDPAAPSAITDEHGAFRFIAISRAPHWIAAYDPRQPVIWFPSARVSDVAPGGSEILLRVLAQSFATSTITGRIVCPDASTPFANVTVVDRQSNRAEVTVDHSSNGKFRLGPLPSREYQVRVKCIGFASWNSSWCDLGADSTWSLEDIRVRPCGSLKIHPTGPEPRGEPHFRLVGTESRDREYVLTDRHDGRRTGSFFRASVDPGPYRLEWFGLDLVEGSAAVEIRSGEATEIKVALQRAPGLYVEIELPSTTSSQGFASVEVRERESGTRAFRSAEIPQGGRFFHCRLDLPKTPVRLIVTTDSDLRGELDVDPTSSTADVDVSMKLH